MLLFSTAPQQPVVHDFSHSKAVRLARPFSGVAGVRELPDGRLVVVDPEERAVYLADFVRQTVSAVGARGDGPGEYRLPSSAHALGGDSTLILDRSGGRQLLLTNGSLTTAVTGANRPGGARGFNLRGVDSVGNRYGEGTRLRQGRGEDRAQLTDSASIERLIPHSGVRDTIALIQLEPGATVEVVGELVISFPRLRPFDTNDQWAVSRSGVVAIAHFSPFYVEMYAPGRKPVRGPRVSHSPIRVTDAHKRQWTAKQVAYRLNGRNVGSSSGPWPEHLPPFLPGALSFAPDGRLWVRRTAPTPASAAYDVFNESAVRVARVVLPDSSALVGFGRDKIYLLEESPDGLMHLSYIPVSSLDFAR